jgi:hypothetical protein
MMLSSTDKNAPSFDMRSLRHFNEVFNPSGNVGLGFLSTVSIPAVFKVPLAHQRHYPTGKRIHLN